MSLSNTSSTVSVSLNWKEQEYDHTASVDNTMRQTDWPALCRLAASLRDDVPCVPLDHATNGLNNMARLLQFEDGVLWVARVALRRSAADMAKLRIGGPFDTATAFFAAWADNARFPRSPDNIVDLMRGAPDTQAKQIVRAVDTFVSRFRAIAPRLARRHDRNRDRGPFPLCHPDFLHSNIVVDDANFDVLGIIDWEGACTLPWELVRFPRFLNAMPRRFGPSDGYDVDGQPHDTDEQQRWRERRAYVQTVAALEAREAPERGPVDRSLSACLADEHAQNLSYAIDAFEGGKVGVYDQLLDDLEEALPPGGESL
ncbi:hypothetical protein SPBR_01926 [Sporothrix brasiliensis 5110]|uniref:Aminoglycoside phosphotransferase domain-containing protein n=1 Tax=Sporothrix brasiliensis 5110 TaxID=1398154 RepID=A0A0C2IWC9_9PEZI|nr:uncharacterized protein SPBR_01926 [Sporothrix brasiliensis 5110]KIH91085.1 hypothetical protein SPBR_01926 [Sporothrix brasiliensis 5110]